MNIAKEQSDKVIAALTIGMSWAAAGKSDSAVTFCDEALTIMRWLADVEPTMWRSTTKVNGLHYLHSDGPQKPEFKYVEWEPLYASPQAAQTEAALSEVVRLSEDAGLYGSDFQTEAQQAFIQPPQPYKVSPGRGC